MSRSSAWTWPSPVESPFFPQSFVHTAPELSSLCLPFLRMVDGRASFCLPPSWHLEGFYVKEGSRKALATEQDASCSKATEHLADHWGLHGPQLNDLLPLSTLKELSQVNLGFHKFPPGSLAPECPFCSPPLSGVSLPERTACRGPKSSKRSRVLL